MVGVDLGVLQGTSEDDKLPLAAYHLEGEAQLWYQLFKESEDEPTWELMKNSLHVRYGPTQFDDFYEDLTKLKQTGTVREYRAQYERLMSRAGRLSANQQIGGFVSGLKENIRAEVQAWPSFNTSRPCATSLVGPSCNHNRDKIKLRNMFLMV